MKKNIVLLFYILIVASINSINAQYRVYANTGVSRQTSMGMLDKKNYPFVAQYADGFNIQPAGWNLLSTIERTTIVNQFTNKNVILESVYVDGVNPNTTPSVLQLPSGVNITGQMIYSEAPDIDTTDIKALLSFGPTMPLFTNNRSFVTSKFNRDRLALVSGMSFEFNVTYDTAKFNDVAYAIKYAIDLGKTIYLLNPNQANQTGNGYVSDYKRMFYYLKKKLPSSYLYSDKLIFCPANYNGKEFLLTPETDGAGSLCEVEKWLIEQKTTDRTYLQPDVSFTNITTGDFFAKASNITVNTTVAYAGTIASVKLYLNGVLVGQDNAAPYSFSGGLLNNLQPGIYELKAVATDVNGKTGDRYIAFTVKKDALLIPGTINATDVSTVNSTVDISGNDFIHNIRASNTITYKLNVTKAGVYDVTFGVNINPAKQTGGTIILKKGITELGRVSTLFNAPNPPSGRNPLVVAEQSPDSITIPNVSLQVGVQDITLNFANPPAPNVSGVMFEIATIDFKLQGSPNISFITPKVKEGVSQFFGPYAIQTGADAIYEAGTNATITINAIDTNGTVSKVDLYKDNVLIRTLTTAPYTWNNAGQDAALNNLAEGTFVLRAEATDNSGNLTTKSIWVKVIKQSPYKPNFQIPGIIEAEDYDKGGEGISFHDVSTALSGVAYRLQTFRDTVSVSTAASASNGYCISATLPGEWLEYTVNANTDGIYKLSFYNAAPTSGRTFSVLLDGVNIGTKNIRVTPNATTFDSVTIANVAISAGDHIVRIINNTGGYNFDRILFTNEKANQTITFPPIPNKSINDVDFTPPGITINSPLAITYTSSNLNVATIVAGKIHLVGGIGTTLITASQIGNASYNPATNVLQPLIVNTVVLPVNLVNFTAVVANASNRINWMTTNEINNDYYTIERSSDGINYSLMNTLQSNTSNGLQHSYELYDYAPNVGINFYRLTQFDKDGKSQILGIRTCTFRQLGSASAKLYPNPSTGNLYLQLSGYSGTQVSITINDINGKVVYKTNLNTSTNSYAYPILLQNKLASGQYTVVVNGIGLKAVSKIIIQ